MYVTLYSSDLYFAKNTSLYYYADLYIRDKGFFKYVCYGGQAIFKFVMQLIRKKCQNTNIANNTGFTVSHLMMKNRNKLKSSKT